VVILFPTQRKLFSSATGLDLPQKPIILDVLIYFGDIVEWDMLLFYLVAASFYFINE